MRGRSDNFVAGTIFLAIAALFGLTALKTLDVGSVETMGPGFFPIMMSLLLTGLAIAIMISGSNASERRPIPWRAAIFITLAPIAFGLSVRSIGLVPALLAAVTMDVFASRRIGWAQRSLIILGMTAFCVAVFSYGIGITAELFIWPPQRF